MELDAHRRPSTGTSSELVRVDGARRVRVHRVLRQLRTEREAAQRDLLNF
jgi:hypothetical protein